MKECLVGFLCGVEKDWFKLTWQEGTDRLKLYYYQNYCFRHHGEVMCVLKIKRLFVHLAKSRYGQSCSNRIMLQDRLEAISSLIQSSACQA